MSTTMTGPMDEAKLHEFVMKAVEEMRATRVPILPSRKRHPRSIAIQSESNSEAGLNGTKGIYILHSPIMEVT
jgi:hypothetical protein